MVTVCPSQFATRWTLLHPLVATLFPYTTLFRSRVSRLRRPGSIMQPYSCAAGAVIPKDRKKHTSELQSHSDLVCRLLLEKKNGYAIVASYLACNIRGLMVTVCPSQFATRRTLFH